MNRKRDVRAMIVVFFVVVFGMLFGPHQAADAMVPEDIYSLRSINLLGVSSDGNFMLYEIGLWEDELRKETTTIYRRDLATDRDQLLFTPADKSSGLVISPDAKTIAYKRTTDEGVELWAMDQNGDDRHRISEGTGQFGTLNWSPDGEALAWITQVTNASYEGLPDHYTVADEIGFRHVGEGYRHAGVRQVYVMNVADSEVVQIPLPAMDVRNLSWAPDSRRLVVEAKRPADLGRTLNTDLWLLSRDDAEAVQLTYNPGADVKPNWHASDRIAYLRATEPLAESAHLVLAELDPAQGEAGGLKIRGDDYDNFFSSFIISDGVPYIRASHRGCLDVVRLGDDGPEFITDGGHNYSALNLVGNQLYLKGTGMTDPGTIYRIDLTEKVLGPHHPIAMIDPNREWRQKANLVEPEQFTVEVDGRVIEGWYFKPDLFEEGEKVPTVLSIHGGPQWMYGGYFLTEFHILPHFGYGVVICNPTGSMGYGMDFMGGVRGDWAGRPGREVLASLDKAIADGWVDPDRVAVMGGSYGGFLGAALTTQTDRFRAAALDRMLVDTASFWGMTDEKWFPEWEFYGRPFDAEAKEIYRRNSPYHDVAKVTTPTLVSHGVNDLRCLIAGGELWFSALKSQDVPSRLIRFEQEGHGIKNKANLVFYNNQLLNWFDLHVLGIEAEHDLETHDE